MSRFFGGMSVRVFVAAAICSALTAALMIAVILNLTVNVSMERIAALAPQNDPSMQQRCERDPAFYLNRGPDIGFDFYDIKTLKPATAGMQPVDPILLARFRAGEPVPVRFFWFQLPGRTRGGASLSQVADSGPCSLLQMRWQLSRKARNAAWVALLIVPTLCMALGFVLTSLLAVRPLSLRLARLRRATQQVGIDSGYASAADPELDDVGQLSSLLDQAHARIAAYAKSAKERQQALEQHLANVAHDLRTPLASLQLTIERLSGSTQLTIDRLADSSSTPSNDLVRNAIDDVVYMGALIGNLYLACRLQDGADPLHGDPRVELCALVEQVTRRFAKLGKARAIDVQCSRPDGPVLACCNPAMAEQVLANLVHNAVTHGEEGGHVAVLLATNGGLFTLQVVDDGPGILPADLPRIGERTFRSDAARQRDPHGGGLGLAIVGEVCRLADFSLSFSREEPRGLRVTVAGRRVSS